MLPLCSVYTADAEKAGMVNSFIEEPHRVVIIFNPEDNNFESYEKILIANDNFVSSEEMGKYVKVVLEIPKEFKRDFDNLLKTGKYSDLNVKTKEQIINYFYLLKEYSWGIFFKSEIGNDKADRRKWVNYLNKEFQANLSVEDEVWRSFNLEDEVFKEDIYTKV
jgi:hypothetical protein